MKFDREYVKRYPVFRVEYWKVFSKEYRLDTCPKTKFSDCCFSDFSRHPNDIDNNLIKIVYRAPVYKKILTKDDVICWVNFLNQIFDKKRISYKIINRKNDLFVFWILDARKLRNIEILLYLTAFRYVDEYPTIVKDLSENHSTDINDLFHTFQESHINYSYPNFPLKAHALIKVPIGKDCPSYIILGDLKKNLNDPYISLVQKFFVKKL